MRNAQTREEWGEGRTVACQAASLRTYTDFLVFLLRVERSSHAHEKKLLLITRHKRRNARAVRFVYGPGSGCALLVAPAGTPPTFPPYYRSPWVVQNPLSVLVCLARRRRHQPQLNLPLPSPPPPCAFTSVVGKETPPIPPPPPLPLQPQPQHHQQPSPPIRRPIDSLDSTFLPVCLLALILDPELQLGLESKLDLNLILNLKLNVSVNLSLTLNLN